MAKDYVKGDKELIEKLRNLSNHVENGLGKVAMAGAATLDGFVKTSMNEGKHGRRYSRGGKSHIASAPGEAPAIDYGALINSLHFKQTGPAEAEYFTNGEYAQPLEFGTGRMQARPFMRPAVDEHKDEIVQAMRATATRLVKEAS